MNLKDRIKSKVEAWEASARPWARRNRLNAFVLEFVIFGLKQAWASLFGGAMLFLLVATHLYWPTHSPVARYDALVIAAMLIQVFMLATGLERWNEALVIVIFHVVGTVMEVFKTAHGSWIYPEASILRIGGVPLFSGFMYASIGSYIARVMRLMDIHYERLPPLWAPWMLALLSYANFFTHHYIPDIRWGLFAFSAFIWGRTWVIFTPDIMARRMPLIVSALLVALFIWVAENFGTFATAWVYPSQRHAWSLVPIAKIGSWYLLVTLSFVLVTLVHRPVRIGRADSPARAPPLYGRP
jgi:uncharacterized membrane protein YoaT (DUF817 family)